MELKGSDELRRKLEQLVRSMPDEVGKALFQEAQIEATESRRRTPVDTGTLRDTHEVGRPEKKGNDIEVTISVGGPAAPYAYIVHEDIEAHHDVGQSKFLQSTILESKPHILARIARRLDLRKLLR